MRNLKEILNYVIMAVVIGPIFCVVDILKNGEVNWIKIIACILIVFAIFFSIGYLSKSGKFNEKLWGHEGHQPNEKQ